MLHHDLLRAELTPESVGIVVIGRNEGERLRRCLESVAGRAGAVVYVDSGSTDGSVELAEGMGALVHTLDAATPFTAARARNEGAEMLVSRHPELSLVQFIDGDCELIEGWLEAGTALMDREERAAVVAGAVKERFPEASVYNRLCGLEWDQPPGEVEAVGGIFLARVDVFRSLAGFDASLIAGEEPELCLRLRRAGWSVQRLAEPMCWHDTAMTRFGQWWRRNVRAGHTYAEGVRMHGKSSERYNVRPLLSNFVWGGVLPALALLLAWWTRGWSLCLFGLHLLLWARIAARSLRFGLLDALLYGFFLVLGKLPQAWGQLRFFGGVVLGKRSGLIEYK